MSDGKLAVISDFDGVFADSFAALYELNVAAMAAVGRDVSEEEFRRWFIRGIKKSKRELLTSDAEYQQMLAAFEKYNADYYDQADLFSFASDFIGRLSKIAAVVIVSSTRDDLVRKFLDKQKLSVYFQAILGGADLSKKRMFEQAVSILRTLPSQIFFISDTVGDLQEGQEQGFKTIAVTWGFHRRELLQVAQPEFIAEDYLQLLAYLSEK